MQKMCISGMQAGRQASYIGRVVNYVVYTRVVYIRETGSLLYFLTQGEVGWEVENLPLLIKENSTIHNYYRPLTPDFLLGNACQLRSTEFCGRPIESVD